MFKYIIKDNRYCFVFLYLLGFHKIVLYSLHAFVAHHFLYPLLQKKDVLNAQHFVY